MEEIWKPVAGHENIYQVSNFGRVKSLKRAVNNNGGIKNVEERILKLNKSSGRYLMVTIGNTNIRIHRLVAKAFIPNPENKPFVNHIDNVPHNNNVSNLEWCINRENMEHASKLGLMKGAPKLSDETVFGIVKLKNKLKIKEIAKRYKISEWQVNSIISGRRWSRITGIKPVTRRLSKLKLSTVYL